ncbi:winged helix-turn-helix domain-containing protein [Serratia silvae]|uniref:Winged helix-turn-helix domain-containing protein n=1 Tax=Serratia silvae TaxID=2824122 RepID=A0ABT0K6W6_9GAMM|nr:winged helix-turn-helix domain-containing protein [Serratia silvae]MCL1027758.1 winged helix-turn-helix domain-containing protein [Serratia silvae]
MTSNCNDCYYLIGDAVEFWPEENLLYSRVNGERITLFIAASRCLRLLLSHQGELIPQRDLFEAGWQKNGLEVSNNTFYQNILMLRKGLKLAGYEQAVIKTVPRQGLTIPSAVPVAKIMPDISTVTAEEHPIAEESQPLTSSKVNNLPLPLSRYVWAILLSLSFCVGVALFAVWNSSENKNFFSNFNFVGNIEQCSVYLQGNQTSFKSYMQFIAQNNFTCNEHEVVYFTTNPLVPRASAIRCERPFSSGSKNTCISEYHLEWQHNE